MQASASFRASALGGASVLTGRMTHVSCAAAVAGRRPGASSITHTTIRLGRMIVPPGCRCFKPCCRSAYDRGDAERSGASPLQRDIRERNVLEDRPVLLLHDEPQVY